MDSNVLLNCFGLLFLTILSNFSDRLLSCDLQAKCVENVWVKHILTYLLLMFFIVAIDKKAYETAAQKQWVVPWIFLMTLVVYLMFLIITKMDAVYAFGVLVCIVAYMLIDIEKTGKHEKGDTQTVERLNQVQLGLVLMMIAAGSYGFVTYFFRQRREYGDQFRYSTFLLGTPTCARFQT
jgi:hypothetical protein